MGGVSTVQSRLHPSFSPGNVFQFCLSFCKPPRKILVGVTLRPFFNLKNVSAGVNPISPLGFRTPRQEKCLTSIDGAMIRFCSRKFVAGVCKYFQQSSGSLHKCILKKNMPIRKSKMLLDRQIISSQRPRYFGCFSR